MVTVAELTANFNIKVKKDSFSKIKKGLQGITKSAKVVAVGLIAVTAGLVKITRVAATFGDTIDKMSKRLGISTDAVQVLGLIFEEAGGSVGGLEKAVTTLNSEMAKVTPSKDFSKGLKLIGLTIKDIKGKDAEEQLAIISEATQNTTDAEKQRSANLLIFGKRLGDQIRITDFSRKSVEEQTKAFKKQGLVLEGPAVKGTAKLNDVLGRMSKALKVLIANIGAVLLPLVKKIQVNFGTWAAKNKDLIATKVEKFVTKLAAVLDKIIPIVGFFLNNIDLLIAAFVVFKAAAVAAWLATLGPIGLIAAAVAAFAALVIIYWDEIKAAFIAVWDAIKDAFSAVIDFIVGAIKAYLNLWLSVWKAIKGAFLSVINFIGDVFSSVFDGIGSAISFVGDLFSSMWNGVKDIFSSVINFIVNTFNGFINFFIDNINKVIRLANKIPGVNIGEIGRLGEDDSKKASQRADQFADIIAKASRPIRTRAAPFREAAAPTVQKPIPVVPIRTETIQNLPVRQFNNSSVQNITINTTGKVDEKNLVRLFKRESDKRDRNRADTL